MVSTICLGMTFSFENPREKLCEIPDTGSAMAAKSHPHTQMLLLNLTGEMLTNKPSGFFTGNSLGYSLEIYEYSHNFTTRSSLLTDYLFALKSILVHGLIICRTFTIRAVRN